MEWSFCTRPKSLHPISLMWLKHNFAINAKIGPRSFQAKLITYLKNEEINVALNCFSGKLSLADCLLGATNDRIKFRNKVPLLQFLLHRRNRKKLL